MAPATVIAYLKSWTFPRIGDEVKVIYLASRKPVIKVMGNTKRNAAICGLTATNPKSTICLSIIKL